MFVRRARSVCSCYVMFPLTLGGSMELSSRISTLEENEDLKKVVDLQQYVYVRCGKMGIWVLSPRGLHYLGLVSSEGPVQSIWNSIWRIIRSVVATLYYILPILFTVLHTIQWIMSLDVQLIWCFDILRYILILDLTIMCVRLSAVWHFHGSNIRGQFTSWWRELVALGGLHFVICYRSTVAPICGSEYVFHSHTYMYIFNVHDSIEMHRHKAHSHVLVYHVR
jgi:hypothetical protein